MKELTFEEFCAQPMQLVMHISAEKEPLDNYCKECLTYNGHQEVCSHYTISPQPKKQEPVEWNDENVIEYCLKRGIEAAKKVIPQRTWVGLTDAEQKTIADLASANDWHDFDVIDATEAKLKEKNT